MARLISVLASEINEWPEEIEHFWCEPDGEIRGWPIIDHDFYPKILVDDADRGKEHGDDDIRVTQQEWDFARTAFG